MSWASPQAWAEPECTSCARDETRPAMPDVQVEEVLVRRPMRQPCRQ